ncbi:MAG: hypothetical protein ACFFDU_03725 [Candidatus Thorarchaeota archaeon]
MKKRKQKITIEGLAIEGKTCDITITFTDGLPSSIIDSISTALKSNKEAVSSPEGTITPPEIPDVDSWTVRQKVRYIVLRNCRHGWFTSKDIQELYDHTFHSQIPLATASTYLSRMHKEGSLTRRGSAAQREYRLNIEDLTDEIATVLAHKI